MEASAEPWFSDSGMDLPSLFHSWEPISFDQFNRDDIWEDFNQSISSESYNSYPPINPMEKATSNTISGSSLHNYHTNMDGRPMKTPKVEGLSSCTTEKDSKRKLDSSTPRILSFGNPESSSHLSEFYTNFVGGAARAKEVDSSGPRGSKRKYESTGLEDLKVKNAGYGAPHSNQDHIMAERKRREKLSQRFIALSAIVPGLKKMDKASVLGDAIKHLQQLQEKVRTLEEQAMKRTVESAVLVKKSQLSAEDDSSSCDENFDGHQSGESVPEIEVKLSGKTILVRIHCENRKGVIAKALSVIESLHLTVSNTSATPFTGSYLDITVTAQMDEEFSMTVKDLLKKLNSSFRDFM